MSSSNIEEKMEDLSLMEEKVGEVEPISYISGDEAAAEEPAEADTDIAEIFSSDEEEELLTPAPSLSPSAVNLAKALDEVAWKNKEDTLACSVCYTALDKSNIVNTPCKHVYCWECFFKWVTNAPTCPMCRKNFVSENAWYENRDVDQDRNDLRELVNIYQRELVSLSLEFKNVNKSLNCSILKLTKTKHENDENMRRLISSREQIAYNEGYIGGQRDVNNNLFKEKFMRQQCNLNTPWFQGYSKAQWEIRYTDRATSGPKLHIPKSIGELNEDEMGEYNKHNMGFKKAQRKRFSKKKNKDNNEDDNEDNEGSKTEVENNISEIAADTPAADDGEEKTENFDYTTVF